MRKRSNVQRVYMHIVCMHVCECADLEILHGRWLMGWLPIVNYTGARGRSGRLIMMDVSWTKAILHNLELMKGVASHPISTRLDQPLMM